MNLNTMCTKEANNKTNANEYNINLNLILVNPRSLKYVSISKNSITNLMAIASLLYRFLPVTEIF